MRAHDLAHVRDEDLLRDLATLVARDRAITADILAHIAEVDARRLYLPAAYPSMHAYCVGALHLADDAAYKRVQAARATRRFPQLFEAVADGRLHLAAVCLLAPHLTPENADALIAGATHRRKSEIEVWLARIVTNPSGPSSGSALDPVAARLAPGQVEKPVESCEDFGAPQASGAGLGRSPGSGQASPPTGLALAAQLAPGQVEEPFRTIALHLRLDPETHAKLRRAQELLSHAVPSGDLVDVLARALDALITQLEKRKFAAKSKPNSNGHTPGGGQDPANGSTHAGQPRVQPRQRPGARRPSRKPRPRSLPAHVRRAVWERDEGRCTFTSATGHRCGSRKRLEFDHVVPVARGGQATVEGLRLRCRGHNQYEAEHAFGSEFMRAKVEEARQVRQARHARQVQPPNPDHAGDVWIALRRLGFRISEARLGAQYAATLRHATLEECVRAALQFLTRGRTAVAQPRLATAVARG